MRCLFFTLGKAPFFMQTATINQHRERDYEDYRAFEYERRRIDEITNATERIAVPMRNTFEYTYEQGDLWFQGQNIRTILETTIRINEKVVETKPQFITELIRNHIELDEYGAELLLAAGEDDDPDILAVMSPIPDAAVAGIDLGAYDRSRMKMLVRIYQRTPNGVEATSLSLDRSDRVGMEAIAARFGVDIPYDATSEDILSLRLWGRSEEFEDVATDIRKLYDTELAHQFGGFWYAGRQDKEILDARTFVEAQTDLVEEHLEIITFIHEFGDPATRKAELKAARYNFAAALTRRLRGEADAASMGDAGDTARANGEKYDGDCPDGDEVTAAQSLNALGLAKTGEIKMTCPFCGFATHGDPCATVLRCTECSAAVSGGKVISKGIGRRGVIERRMAGNREAVNSTKQPVARTMTKQDVAKAKYGEHASVRNEKGVGSSYDVIYDRRTGDVIDRF
jgi:hypothetical protein